MTGFGAGGGGVLTTGLGAGGGGGATTFLTGGGGGATTFLTGGGGGGVTTFLTSGARVATRTGSGSGLRNALSRKGIRPSSNSGSSHHHLKPPFFSTVVPAVTLLETDVATLDAAETAPLMEGRLILPASAAGRVTSPAALDQEIWVPSGPTKLLVQVSPMLVVSSLG